MNYRDKPELRDKLAAEYVLGTLKGGARRRFEGWLHNDAALRRTTDEWRDRLMPMGEFAGSAEPPARVWKDIERRLNLRTGAGPSKWSASLNFWRSLGMASSGLAAVLAAVLVLRSPAAPPVDHVATLTDAQSQAAMLLTADSRRNTLDVRVLSALPVADDKTLQLWAINRAGKPRSLGILHDRRGTRLALAQATGSDVALLAISLEPKGGSPDPAGPTGPVLYKGSWMAVL
ncbi:anti-sigma factor [Massilia endophytica]|uniref:anti-sigma factor n=1 Tax=Massilia endophytica TaxID=2899220 RepID=UPI001E627086|nr:anti-sigma factor [Massilia endophytica]UGQ47924.1 anti-sigma factor [Massilia endophytica]